jgi:hypothetical protein
VREARNVARKWATDAGRVHPRRMLVVVVAAVLGLVVVDVRDLLNRPKHD